MATVTENVSVREKLKPLVGKRVKFRGYLSEFSDWVDFRLHKDIGRACISQLERDSEIYADHVWIIGTRHWSKEDMSKQVEFEAVVSRYWDEKNRVNNYCLKLPGNLTVLHGPPALKVPDPVVDDLPTRIPDVDIVESDDLDEAKLDGLETLRAVQAFIKDIGGMEAASKAASALEKTELPLETLIAWIRQMSGTEGDK